MAPFIVVVSFFPGRGRGYGAVTPPPSPFYWLAIDDVSAGLYVYYIFIADRVGFESVSFAG